jgi:hypothetical protein
MPRFFTGLTAFAAAFDIQRMYGDGRVPLVASGALLAIGTVAWRGLRARIHGIRVEHRAAESLQRVLPAGWTMERSVPWRGGDVDLVVKYGQHPPYAIEIKSFHSFWIANLQHVAGPVSRRDNPRQRRCLRAINQARRAASSHSAVPVLWLPRSTAPRNSKIFGVLIVQGDAAQLMSALAVLKPDPPVADVTPNPPAPESVPPAPCRQSSVPIIFPDATTPAENPPAAAA